VSLNSGDIQLPLRRLKRPDCRHTVLLNAHASLPRVICMMGAAASTGYPGMCWKEVNVYPAGAGKSMPAKALLSPKILSSGIGVL